VFHFQFAQYFTVSHPRCTSIWTEASAGCPKLQKLSPDDQPKKKKKKKREKIIENAPRVLDNISGESKPFLSRAMCIFVRQVSHPEELNKIITFYYFTACRPSPIYSIPRLDSSFISYDSRGKEYSETRSYATLKEFF
jgi:hypothetical protein